MPLTLCRPTEALLALAWRAHSDIGVHKPPASRTSDTTPPGGGSNHTPWDAGLVQLT